MVALNVPLQPGEMLSNNAGNVFRIGVSTGAVIEQKPATMTNAEFGDVFIQLDDKASFLADAFQVCLSAAEGNERRLDCFNLQIYCICYLH
jgi:hypothetical protein